MKISDDVLRILSGLAINGQMVKITEQLERKRYLEVNKVLEALGGKWDRKAKAHVFQDDPAERLDDAIITASYEKPTRSGFFPTPPAVAAQLLDALDLRLGMAVLEPSAGDGNLVAAAAAVVGEAMVDAVESRSDLFAKLSHRFTALGPSLGDFLMMIPSPIYDRVLMNPPFERLQDIDHVTHALKFLKPGGRLVSVMGAGVTFRQDKKAVVFRALLEDYGAKVVELPDGSFLPSGTGVRSVYVVIDK